MMQNLRNVFTRGGRSSMGFRSFSSPPGSGAGGSILANVFGYAYYIVSVKEIEKIAQANDEFLKLRLKRHKELVDKAMRDLELNNRWFRSRD